MTFHVGQKVVCVRSINVPEGAVERGRIYTITCIRPDSTFGYLDGGSGVGTGVTVEEAPLPPYCWFDATRFRPIAERKTDISIFTSMLNPSKRSVDA